MTQHDESVWLCDMRDNTRKAMVFCRGRTRTDFDSDEMLALAIARLLELIGEAARHVSIETRAKTPHIPWRDIIGTRDILIHAYRDINLDIVWDIVVEKLPILLSQLEALGLPEPQA